MKELEEVNCEIRRVVDFQHSVANRLNNFDGDDRGSASISRGYSDGSLAGGFLNDVTYAWLSYDCRLVVVNVKTGEGVSSWTFRGKVTSVCQFPVQPGELPLLLVGLDNDATRVRESMGLVCVFDCATSRVLRAIRMPAGVEQVCIVSGGAEWEEFNEKRPDNVLAEMGGIACVVLRNLHHIMIDLKRPTWETSNLVAMDETSPAEIEFSMARNTDVRNQSDGKHAAYNLLNNRIEKHIGFNREEFESTAFLEDKLTTAIVSSTKIGCLISGCLGRVIIWQNDGSIGWISAPIDESMIVTHLALLEPTDDPRPFYYLWVVYQDDSPNVPPLLRMYALMFERKYCDRGTNLYFNLEGEPSLKFEFELDPADRVISLSTIERETNPDRAESDAKRGEDNLLLVATTERTLLFDLNQWYKEQMPKTVNECKNPNSIIAHYSTKLRRSDVTDNQVLGCAYVPNTLQEFPNNSPSSSEELFYPNSLSLQWVELCSTKLTSWMSRGVQAELLRQMAIAGPVILTQPSETFHRCLSVGLAPFNSEYSFASEHNAQREMLLSLCLEQRWATFLVRCAKEWSDGSASFLYPSFLKWGVQRAASIKTIADQLCVPLFDQSGSNIGETEVKTLRFCSQQLECLSNIVAKLPFETNDLIKQQKALKRVSMYFQVILWFYDVGLLPETQNLQEESLPISLALRVPYPFEKLSSRYREKRAAAGDDADVLFIDELIARECPGLKSQWEREAGDAASDGLYPPPSLQSLVRGYLTDCRAESEIECKHQITIYLLMDLATLLQGSYPGVDQLIKYPSAFKMSPSLIKLTQAFWLLDHRNYQEFLDMMTGQLVLDTDVRDWHHKLILRTLVRNNQHKLALTYLRIRKPPLSSVEDQSTLISLSVEHGLVQSAFHRRPQSHYAQLLICFFQACKAYGKLNDILHLALNFEEEEVFIKFLEHDKSPDMRLLYYLQRCRYAEANGNSVSQSNTKMDGSSLTMLNAYNATLPDVIKRFSGNVKANAEGDLEPRYPRPMSHHKSCNSKLNVYESLIRKVKETYMKAERFQIPFISAPSVSLKLNEERANVDCVLFPKFANNRKRTLEDVYQDDEGTPDGAKRRKLVNDSEASLFLNATLNTPLVKPKVNAASKTPAETPHSILKIRQMIRNSTSPADLQPDTETAKADKKINRQIRFNISQNCAEEEVQDEVSGADVYFSPSATRSLTEDTVLSDDSSYINKSTYTPRPRPGLRRSCSQTASFAASPVCNSTFDDLQTSKSSVKPQLRDRTCNSFSASIYTDAILSSDTSYEMSISSRVPGEDSKYWASTPLRTSPSADKLQDPPQAMDVDEEVPEDRNANHLNLEREPTDEGHLGKLRSKFKNGDVAKPSEPLDTSDVQTLCSNDPEETFESFTNAENLQEKEKEFSPYDQDSNVLGPGNVDITDDESLNSVDEMVLAFDDSTQEKTVPENLYDTSNITEDESDCSVDKPDAASARNSAKVESGPGVEESNFRLTRSRRASSMPKEEPTSPAGSPSQLATPGARRTRRATSLVKEVLTSAVEKNIKRTSSGSTEPGTSSPRTRARRASSVAKDAEPQVPRGRRASSSLAGEPGDEEVPSKGRRTRNATGKTSKSAKGAKEEVEEADVKPTRRRRGSSVPKETAADVVRTRRSSSLAKETVPEEFEQSLKTIREHPLEPVSSPAANTRSRRLSIQSVPEELEEILSVPSAERIPAVAEKKPRTRLRAASVESSETEIRRRTRNLRSRSVLEDTIAEEEPAGTAEQGAGSNAKKVPIRRKRTASETSRQSLDEKPRRGRKQSQKAGERYSFSEPGQTGNPPVDDKAIGQVPNYVFSPPQTRSKAVAPELHRH